MSEKTKITTGAKVLNTSTSDHSQVPPTSPCTFKRSIHNILTLINVSGLDRLLTRWCRHNMHHLLSTCCPPFQALGAVQQFLLCLRLPICSTVSLEYRRRDRFGMGTTASPQVTSNHSRYVRHCAGDITCTLIRISPKRFEQTGVRQHS